MFFIKLRHQEGFICREHGGCRVRSQPKRYPVEL
jgi:hypothetical protein